MHADLIDGCGFTHFQLTNFMYSNQSVLISNGDRDVYGIYPAFMQTCSASDSSGVISPNGLIIRIPHLQPRMTKLGRRISSSVLSALPTQMNLGAMAAERNADHSILISSFQYPEFHRTNLASPYKVNDLLSCGMFAMAAPPIPELLKCL